MIAFYRIETMPKKKLNEMEQRAAQEAVHEHARQIDARTRGNDG